MRDDHVLAARELDRLRNDLRRLRSSSSEEFVARLGEVARLFTEHALVAEAARAAAGVQTAELQAVWRTCMQWFEQHLRPRIRQALTHFHRLGKMLPEEGPLSTRLATPLEWQAVSTDVRGALRWLAEESDWSCLGHEDVVALNDHAWPQLCLGLRELHEQRKLDTDTAQAVDQLHTFALNIDAAIRGWRSKVELLWGVARAADHRHTLRELAALHRGMTALRSGIVGNDLALVLAAQNQLHALVLATDSLLSATLAHLQLGPVRAHAVRRLKTWLERWDRDSLHKRMRAAPRRREAVLQDAVDRFLFSEGLFPITHAVAGRGKLDTFLAESERLFHEASASRQPGILIELKQALDLADGKKGEEALRGLVRDALAQAREYASHMKANASWRDHEVFCIIAYGGHVRYDLVDEPHVTLIYLGPASPSRKAQPLALA